MKKILFFFLIILISSLQLSADNIQSKNRNNRENVLTFKKVPRLRKQIIAAALPKSIFLSSPENTITHIKLQFIQRNNSIVLAGDKRLIENRLGNENLNEVQDSEQETAPYGKTECQNAAFFELFGNAVLYSFNIEFNLQQSLYLRLGFGGGIFKIGLFPFMINYYKQLKKVSLELGAGGLYEYDFDETSTVGVDFTFTIGLRFRFMKRGFIKAALTPVFHDVTTWSFGLGSGIYF